MWNQPATARQIAALKANGNFDGNYYSKGRAGQKIGESMRSTSGMSGSNAPTSQQRSSPSSALGLNELAKVADMIGNMRPSPDRHEPAAPQAVVAHVVENEGTGSDSRRPLHSQAEPAGVLSLQFIGALEARHLDDYRANHTHGSGDRLRQETEEWTKVKLLVARRIAEAHVALASVLGDAPSGVAPVPEAAAVALLTHAVSPDLEERHLWSYLNEHTHGSASRLRSEIVSWLESRIALASTNAQGLIELAQARNAMQPTSAGAGVSPASVESAPSACVDDDAVAPASIPNRSKPPERRQGGAVWTGKVTSINAAGAHVALDGRMQGWLHISRLRILNGGARVDDVADHLRVGQPVQVRDIGTGKRGQVLLELADQGTAAATPKAPRASAADPTSEAVSPAKRRGFFRRRVPRAGEK